jgi:hypothetical protein
MPLNAKRDVSSGIMLSGLSLYYWRRGNRLSPVRMELESHVTGDDMLCVAR